MKTYKVTFFDCDEIFSVQTYHRATCAWSVLRNAAVQIVTLGLCPYITMSKDDIELDEARVNNILYRLCEEIEDGYVQGYFTRMEQEGRT